MCEPSFAKGGFRGRNVDVDGVERPLGIAFFFASKNKNWDILSYSRINNRIFEE